MGKELSPSKQPDHRDYRQHWIVKRDLKRAKTRRDAHGQVSDEQFAVLLWEATGIPTADTGASYDHHKHRWEVFVNIEDAGLPEPKVVYKSPAEIAGKDFQWAMKIGEEAMFGWVELLDRVDSHSMAYNAISRGLVTCPPTEGKKIAAAAFLEEWTRMHPAEDPKQAPNLERVFKKLGVTGPIGQKRYAQQDPFEDPD